MFSTCAITLSLLLSVVNGLEDVSIYEDEASDPRLFFANYTSGLLAVNTTILAYAGIIVAAGVVGVLSSTSLPPILSPDTTAMDTATASTTARPGCCTTWAPL